MVAADARQDGRPAACTTNSAAAFIAIQSTNAGWCRISKKCSTTTRCWPATYVGCLARDEATRLRPRGARDVRLRAPRNDRSGRRLLQHAGRRQRRAKKENSFVWTPAELVAALGADAARTFAYVYDVSDRATSKGATSSTGPRRSTQCAAILGRDADDLAAELAAAARSCCPSAANASSRAWTTKCWWVGTA